MRGEKSSIASPAAAVRLACASLAAILLALAALTALGAGPAYADSSSVATATASASYVNPDTGQIDDSGGKENEALGTSMCQGITGTSALVEKDTDGNTFVTIRLSEGDQLGQVSIASDASHANRYGDAVAAQLMQQDTAANTADYRAQVASDDATLRVSMFVNPMGRSVVFFVTLSAEVAGNAAGFVESVTPGQAAAEDKAPAAGASSSEQAGQSAASSQDKAADSGVKEFDGEGNEVDGSSGSALASPTTYAVAAGIAVVVIAAVAAVYYAVRGRKRKAERDRAAAAAAGYDDDEPPRV